ncbi:hypothetical protein HGRIS_006972 [Hohenbuehelia grisea]|uniref:Uncharacterized protein n=1 Tax=Hohenbuehelia grisea TaxID=104357 RepID=A0ABR3JAM1_9AGAR
MIDLLSLAANVLSFLDAAFKIKETMIQVKENEEKLTEVQKKVDTLLIEHEVYCRAVPTSCGDPESKAVKEELGGFRRDVLYLQAKYRLINFKTSNPFKIAKSKTRAWVDRADIGPELERLDKSADASQARFLSYRSARVEMLTSRQESMQTSALSLDFLASVLLAPPNPNMFGGPDPLAAPPRSPHIPSFEDILRL